MGYTNHQYPVWEVAVSLVEYPPTPSGHERLLEGDIVACRPPYAGVGSAEMHNYVWLRVEGIEDGEAWLEESVQGATGAYQKRRYQIPLERLAEVYPAFDPALARDRSRVYQPFLGVDEETGVYTVAVPPLPVHGLVFDTVTGSYL